MNHYFDGVIKKRPLFFFFYVLIAFNIVFISMFFSGSAFLQSLIVPEIEGLRELSWREFGIVEIFQNLFLISIIAIFVYAVFTKKSVVDRGLYFIALCLFLFLFLEEIDYGFHYYEWVTGDLIKGHRNWHNRPTEGGGDNIRGVKQLSDFLMIIVFVLLPLLSLVKPLKKFLGSFAFIPVIQFTGMIVIAFIFARIAHFLDDAGLGLINGIQEHQLSTDISEFRETSNYYIYLLYALQLVSKDNLLSKR